MRTRSILPNSDPEILKPMACGFQVRWHDELDMHVLYHGEQRVAGHHNGYSCHELAKRILSGSAERAMAQFSFITACGGKHYATDADMVAIIAAVAA